MGYDGLLPRSGDLGDSTSSAIMHDIRPGIALVTRQTRLQGLLARWATRGAAKFQIKQAKLREKVEAGAVPTEDVQREAEEEFDLLEDEDSTYRAGVSHLGRELDFGLPVQVVDRDFLPNFDFGRFEAIVVVGQDGLVANTAKYAKEVPIVAVNPDPDRFDGVLLPFSLAEARRAVDGVLQQNYRSRPVTLAEASLQDGQRLLAFNDLFIGAASHVSARYRLTVDDQSEPQSSSGLLVATGAGSTGWLSSVFNMAEGMARWLGGDTRERPRLEWEDRELAWAVREPFVSRQSQANLVAGLLEEGRTLVVESLMPANGVIFSDGVESDFLQFNGGTIARIGVANQRARLVVK